MRPGVAACVLGESPSSDDTRVEVEPLASASRHDDDLVPAIDRVVGRLGGAPKDLAWVAVSVGPGGFTGLRVAIATAQAIGSALSIPVRPVPTGMVAARTALETGSEPDQPLIIVLTSKRGTAWAERYTRADALAPDRTGLITPEQLAKWRLGRTRTAVLADSALSAGPFGEEWITAAGGTIEPLRLCPSACLSCALGVPGVRAGQVRPNYGREPEAVTKWRELHGPRSSTAPDR